MLEQQTIINMALIVGLVALVLLQQRNSHVREMKALDTMKEIGKQWGSVIQSGIALSPQPVRKAAATLETATDSAEEASRKLFGADHPVTKAADTLEDIGDLVFGEGDSEPDELSVEAVDRAIYSNSTEPDTEWITSTPKPSEDEDKQPDDQKPAA